MGFLVFAVFSHAACGALAQTTPPAPFGPVPSARQLALHELEVYGMVNFSTITYYGKEWGYGDEDPAKFNPTEFDAFQIVRAAKAGGLKGLIIDAKHHGGFCLWPSTYNATYTVRNSPWRGGKGDMVKELADACRAEGLQVAIYLSPWDCNHKDYGKPEYVTYYHHQWRELATAYGPLFELWFDGANGGRGWYGGAKEVRSIDARTYYRFDELWAMLRELQPGACIFSDVGPDVRWNGNEAGVSGDPCWSTLNVGAWYPGASDPAQLNRGQRDGAHWIPAEADFPLREGWFWREGAGTRSAADLVNRYFTTVGRNSFMDIGIAPDCRGLIDAHDSAALTEFGRRIAAIFAHDLARTASASASNVRGNDPGYAAANACAGTSKFKTYWATDDGVLDATLTLDFGAPAQFSVVSLREPIQLGQRIDAWALDAWQDDEWREFASGTGIGARRLWRGQAIWTARLRLRIEHASACPALSELGVYLEPEESRKDAGTVIPARIVSGIDKTAWKILVATSEGAPAARAIDGKPETFWHTHTEAGRQAPPQSLVVDMRVIVDVAGFLYLPRQDGCAVGNVTRFRLALSLDNATWADVAEGEFGNIAANPVQQRVALAKPVKARYFRFTAEAAVEGCANAAELGIVRAGAAGERGKDARSNPARP